MNNCETHVQLVKIETKGAVCKTELLNKFLTHEKKKQIIQLVFNVENGLKFMKGMKCAFHDFINIICVIVLSISWKTYF